MIAPSIRNVCFFTILLMGGFLVAEEQSAERALVKAFPEWTPQERELEEKLNQRASFHFENTRLMDVLSEIDQKYGIKMVLDAKPFWEEAGIVPEEITFQFHIEHVPLRIALEQLLRSRENEGGSQDIFFRPWKGIPLLTTLQQTSEKIFSRVYVLPENKGPLAELLQTTFEPQRYAFDLLEQYPPAQLDNLILACGNFFYHQKLERELRYLYDEVPRWTPEEEKILAFLNQPATFDGNVQTLGELIPFLREKGEIGVFCNWCEMDQEPETPLPSWELLLWPEKNLTVGEVLQLWLGDFSIGYIIQDQTLILVRDEVAYENRKPFRYPYHGSVQKLTAWFDSSLKGRLWDYQFYPLQNEVVIRHHPFSDQKIAEIMRLVEMYHQPSPESVKKRQEELQEKNTEHHYGGFM
ncbi:MAG: hypothetical protein Q4D62_03650 [Planctomycetia bacterium]|nr:hypothetical protein [Planctomycetia bacterium]